MAANEHDTDDSLQERVEAAEQSLSAMPQALLGRSTRVSSPLVVSLAEPPPERVRALAGGTVVMFVGEANSQLFARLRDAVSAGDVDLIDLIVERIASDLTRSAIASFEDRGEPMPDATELASVAEFRYGSRLLVRGMTPVPGADVTAGSVLWTGGDLDDERFSFVEYVTDDNAPGLQPLVLKVPPRLSDVERAVIEQVPDDRTELNLRSVDVNVWPAAAARVAWAAARWAWRRRTATTPATATFVLSCEGHFAALPSDGQVRAIRDRLSDPRLGDLQLAVSVDQLLDIRQELMARPPAP